MVPFKSQAEGAVWRSNLKQVKEVFSSFFEFFCQMFGVHSISES